MRRLKLSEAGVQAGDIIQSMDQVEITDYEDGILGLSKIFKAYVAWTWPYLAWKARCM